MACCHEAALPSNGCVGIHDGMNMGERTEPAPRLLSDADARAMAEDAAACAEAASSCTLRSARTCSLAAPSRDRRRGRTRCRRAIDPPLPVSPGRSLSVSALDGVWGFWCGKQN
jgi:hypothetical protein